MSKKSWQRFALSIVMVLGYFAVLGYAMYQGNDKLSEPLIQSLPPMFVAIVTVWFHQAGSEAKDKGTPQ